ncbi:MAG: reprolysin-like metallopeptidase [Pseudomonadota bacterium]
MPSTKAILSCIGRDTSGSISILGHLFGFWRRRVPVDTTGDRRSVSLRDTLNGLEGRHIHVNVIAVGWWDETAASLQDTARMKVDYAIMRTRQIFEQINLGVGRVNHYVISQGEADGADNINGAGEANELWEDWTVDNAGIDCFVVRTINISDPDDRFIGLSPVDGSDDKGGKDDGLIAGAIDRGGAINSSFNGFARTFAHEIGHYLGRPHNHDDGECPAGSAANNLMAQTRCITDTAENAVILTSGQGSDMRDHGLTRSGC